MISILLKTMRISLISCCIICNCVFTSTLVAQTGIPQVYRGSALLEDPYGITSHITWKGYDYDTYRSCFNSISQLGVSYLRTDFNSTGADDTITESDFEIWDNIVSEAVSSHIQLSPLIYPSRYVKYDEKTNKIFRRNLSRCLDRYGDMVRVWEIWNEMDQMYDSDGKVSAKEYIPLLKTSYEVIKKENPSNTVLLGAIGNIKESYFDDLLKYGAADYFDVANLHYYSAREIPESIIPFYKSASNILSKFGVNKPIWLTETGYSSYSESEDGAPDRFYVDVLPKVYNSLGIKIANYKLAVLLDFKIKRNLRNQDNPVVCHGFNNSKAVSLNEIKTLDIKEYPVLMILYGELFPMAFFSDLEDYIRRGGTVVFPEGGAPLYFNLNIDTDEITPVGKTYYRRLHMDCVFSWEEQAKQKEVKCKLTKTKVSSEFFSNYHWIGDDLSSPKIFTDSNLQPGDEMVSIVEGSGESYSDPIAVCYKLNSDLKGNIIAQSRSNNGYQVSEKMQASRYPRLFCYLLPMVLIRYLHITLEKGTKMMAGMVLFTKICHRNLLSIH